MKISATSLLILGSILFFSCNSLKKNSDLKVLNKEASDRTLTMIGYQPIDPIQVVMSNTSKDTISVSSLLANFPNESTRLAIGEIKQNGNVSFGPFSVVRTGKSYSVILDYIKYTTINVSTSYKEYRTPAKFGDSIYITTRQFLATKYGIVEQSFKTLAGKSSSIPEDSSSVSNSVKLPVYLGVGLRIQASITVLGDSVNLSSIWSIGLAASQKKINGTLIIQTLGISGEDISPLMPLPDQINESTIQSAMQALATIKSKIYNKERIIISPQVVAFKLPFPIEGAKDLIETALQSNPPTITFIDKNKFVFKIDDLSK